MHCIALHCTMECKVPCTFALHCIALCTALYVSQCCGSCSMHICCMLFYKEKITRHTYFIVLHTALHRIVHCTDLWIVVNASFKEIVYTETITKTYILNCIVYYIALHSTMQYNAQNCRLCVRKTLRNTFRICLIRKPSVRNVHLILLHIVLHCTVHCNNK